MLNELEKNRLVELEQAFELFNETSMQLTQSYESLQQQVSDLQIQLAKSDREKRRVAERLSRLMQLLPAGVITLDQNDLITEMNPSATQILGEDAMGRNWNVVVMNAFLSVNDAGELMTHDEQAYQFSETSLDQALGKILLIQDVTAARQLQDHVNRHQRLHSMGEMAASLAHQIRTPLASALLYVSQMNSEHLDDQNRERFVGKALNSLRHLEGLVKDMLQYAKGGKGSDQRIELTYLIGRVKLAVENQAKESQSVVQFDSFMPGLVVTGDLDGLVTAMQNLIGNAIDVVGTQAEIQITVHRIADDKVDLIVKDHGPGIETENLEKVFEPFYTSRAQGTGLGLAVVRAIAEAHNGQAWVKSIVGYGSTFGIRLPLAEVKGVE
ncbi:MAG: ATP-binding protein [Pseudomonadota bacterium]|nr:ATP-binding protein [Pseudomonadota bacterium]